VDRAGCLPFRACCIPAVLAHRGRLLQLRAVLTCALPDLGAAPVRNVGGERQERRLRLARRAEPVEQLFYGRVPELFYGMLLLVASQSLLMLSVTVVNVLS
jgi:hypothetical protein